MKIAILGAGNMGGAMCRGIAIGGKDMEIGISSPVYTELEDIKKDHPQVNTYYDNKECIKGADVVLCVVKPWVLSKVMQEIVPVLEPNQVIVSLVGGKSAEEVRDIMEKAGCEDASSRTIYHVIPNIAASVRSSMTFANGLNTNPESDKMVTNIFNCVGKIFFVDDFQMTAGMAVASCGIAFMMRFLRAMTEGGVELGLRPDVALQAAAQTMRGAADLIQINNSHPEQEVDKVTTAGGITIRGLNAMEEAGFTGSIVKGLHACRE